MSLWLCDTEQGTVGVHIENGKVAVHTAGTETENSKLLLSGDPEQALDLSRALEQVAWEIQRRDKRKQKVWPLTQEMLQSTIDDLQRRPTPEEETKMVEEWATMKNLAGVDVGIRKIVRLIPRSVS